MHALIVLAHPEPLSFNGSLKDSAVRDLIALGHTVEVSDLNAMRFDPVEDTRHFANRLSMERFDVQSEQRAAFEAKTTSADVQAEIDKIGRADLVIFQFPIWWFGVPAILKGWMDRVFVYGLYTSRKRYDEGIFRQKQAFLSVTAGGPETSFRHDGRNGDLELLLWPTSFTLHYMGFKVLPHLAAFGVDAKSLGDGALFEAHCAALRHKLRDLDLQAPMPFNIWADWDDSGRLKKHAPSYSPFIRAAE